MSFTDMLEGLKKEYIESLPEKIVNIKEHISSSNITGLKEDFHKLKGTGKTYGIPEVSTLAASVEAICIDNPKVAIKAAECAVEILVDIHQSRSSESIHDIGSDERFIEIRRSAA